MEDSTSLSDWLDRHHVDIVRTFATTLDGVGVGKYVHRNKFASTLPRGHAISDMAAAMDLAGTPHLTFWHEDRQPAFGDIYLRPDLTTLISDGTDSNLGHCICDFVDAAEQPSSLCSRSLLRHLTNDLADRGYQMKVGIELEFFLFQDSYDALRRRQYRHLNPVTQSHHSNVYLVRNAYPATSYMREVISRLEWKGVHWEAWNDEAATGQFELNLEPTHPVAAADNVMRTRQIMYEVAHDMDLAVTFMAMPRTGIGNGMHIHHSLADVEDRPLFHDQTTNGRSTTMEQWLAGLVTTMPGAVSMLCPSINALRRLKDFAAAPTTSHWGEDNKTASLRTMSSSSHSTRIEHRLAAGDANPYLALAVIIAGGLAGIDQQLVPPEPFDGIAWGLPKHYDRLPDTVPAASQALLDDALLSEQLGTDLVEYWTKSRRQEWLLFHREGGDPDSPDISQWEYERYFDLI